MKYPGGKNQPGTWRRIVNLMPPHTVYIECCAGSGAVLRNKRPALQSIAVDLDPKALALIDRVAPNLSLICADVLEWLPKYKWKGCELVYIDPPYLPSTKRYNRYYRFEMPEPQQRRLLEIIKQIPAMVMISGYASSLYDEELAGWERREFRVFTCTHQPRTEVLWMNFRQGDCLHDLRFVGMNFRERWRIKKRIRRWTSRLVRLAPTERAALFSALVDVMEWNGSA
ncbi:MAG TPA: DNA adenine methylase [Lacunisphaera sp.]|nr:DNA adenine methylase [Lacunisphaera sp.]